jgi:phage tail-like protein
MAGYYPPVGFHFKVEFERFPSNSKDIRFKEVGGLSVEIPVENLAEGGENRFKYSLPATPQYPKLVLKRGLLGDSQIADWCKRAIEDFVFETDNITVSLLNEQHEPLALWRVIGAYPCKWSVSDLNADQNAIVVESIEFAYQYFIYEKNP